MSNLANQLHHNSAFTLESDKGGDLAFIDLSVNFEKERKVTFKW